MFPSPVAGKGAEHTVIRVQKRRKILRKRSYVKQGTKSIVKNGDKKIRHRYYSGRREIYVFTQH